MKSTFSVLLAFLSIFVATDALGQIPKSGTYEYEVAFAEWAGKSLGSTVTVVISGGSVKIITTADYQERREIQLSKAK